MQNLLIEPTRTAFLDRREVLKLGIAGTVLAAGGARSGPVVAQSLGLIRRDVAKLTGDQVDALRAGVAVMKGRDPTDPTSWHWQANIHGTYETETTDLEKTCWNTCPHGGYYFFPWHRMYLLHMEHLIRAAAQDPELTMPYWNYTNPDHLAMPEIFLKPADETNPLWLRSREPFSGGGVDIFVGGGDPMPWSLIDPGTAFDYQNFCATSGNRNSFGSTQGPWSHEPPRPAGFGKIEAQPHNPVHNFVGGNASADGGAMADINTAANDPIFFLHHGNIDRLWAYWDSLGDGRSSPTDDGEWMGKAFTFVNEHGEAVQMRPSEVLSTRNLGYRYQTLDPAGNGSMAAAGPITSCQDVLGPLLVASASGSADAPVLALTDGVATATLPPPSDPLALDTTAGGPKPVLLTLEGITTAMRSKIIPLYINLPAGETPSVEGAYFAGAISVFGTAQSTMQTVWSETFDISDVLARQKQQGLYDGGGISVSIAGSVPDGFTIQSVHLGQ